MKKYTYILLQIFIIGLYSCSQKEIIHHADAIDSIHAKKNDVGIGSIVRPPNVLLDVDSFYSESASAWIYALAVETNEWNAEYLPEDSLYVRELWIVHKPEGDSIGAITHKQKGLIQPKNIFLYGPGFSELSFDSTGILLIQHEAFTGGQYEYFEFTEYYFIADSARMLNREYVFRTKQDYSEKTGWEYTNHFFEYDVRKNKLSRKVLVTRFGGELEEELIIRSADTLIIPDKEKQELLSTPLNHSGFEMD